MGFSKYKHPERAVLIIFLLCQLGSGWLKAPEMWPLNSVTQIFHPIIRIGQLLKTSKGKSMLNNTITCFEALLVYLAGCQSHLD